MLFHLHFKSIFGCLRASFHFSLCNLVYKINFHKSSWYGLKRQTESVYSVQSSWDYNPIWTGSKCIQQMNDGVPTFPLKKDKTEVSCFLEKWEDGLKASTLLQSVKIKTKNQASNPGLVIDSDLNLNDHIKEITDQPTIIVRRYQGIIDLCRRKACPSVYL